MATLFDNRDNAIDFRNGTVVAGSYDQGSQYFALGGDDTVWLPFTSKDLHDTGYERQKAFLAGDGNDWVAVGGRLPPGDPGGYNVSYTVNGGAGDDTLYGLDALAPDDFTGGPGDDYIQDYGMGQYISFSGRAANYRITNGEDGLLSVRDLKGHDGVDSIRGDSGFGVFLVFSDRTIRFDDASETTKGLSFAAANARGQDASDRLKGLGGNDRMVGEGGNDTMLGALGDDHLHGNAGRDKIYGDTAKSATKGGNDVLYGDAGDDRLDGEAGQDKLIGGTGRDTLIGGAGNDALLGGANDDVLEGGFGADALTGGNGRDTFIWRSVAETSATSGRADVVRDLQVGDKLSFAAIDADVSLPGNQAFSFIGANGFTGAGQIRMVSGGGETRILLNVDSDSAAEAIIRLSGSHETTANWFVL